ncbi:MAG: hypothetical protein ACTSVV_12815, partial [Promethearchaeota archaeon]
MSSNENLIVKNKEFIREETKKAPYYTLGLIARKLNDFFKIINEENQKEWNIIVKNIPQFIDWIEKSKTNKIFLLRVYNFLYRRFNIYLPYKKIRNYKNFIEKNKNTSEIAKLQLIKQYKQIINIYYELQESFEGIQNFFTDNNVEKLKYSPYNFIYFMQGYDFYMKGDDKFLDAWIKDTFIENITEYKLAFILGRYYYRAADRELRLIRNLGLSKQIISWTKTLSVLNFVKLFRKITISYFHSLRKEEPERQTETETKQYLDNLSRYRKIIEDLFEKFEESTNDNRKISDKIIQFCFKNGFLIRTFPENIKRKKDDEFLAIPKNDIIELIYDLGKIIRFTSTYEKEELKSHSYRDVIKYFRNIDSESILNFMQYLSKIFIRNWLKNASKFLNKKEPEIHEKVNYNWSEFYQNILFKFLNSYQKQFE